MTTFLFALAVVLGGLASWQIFNWMYGAKLRDKSDVLRQESTVLLERIEKVFKVVLAEGYFTEIYDHTSQRAFMGFWKMNKKALVVTRAKVSVGFDFTKMRTRRDEASRKIIVEFFPEPEVIAIDTDYKFYDIDQGWLNKFSHDDYTSMLAEAKRIMQEKAMTSDLPQIAAKQVNVMMQQLAASMNWEVELPPLSISGKKQPILLPSNEKNALPSGEATDYEEVK